MLIMISDCNARLTVLYVNNDIYLIMISDCNARLTVLYVNNDI